MYEKKIWIQRQKFLGRCHLLRKSKSVWVAPGSTGKWWNNVKRNVFFEILDEVTPLLDPKPNCPNYMFLSAEIKLAITLYYQKDTFSLWIGGNTFEIHQCTVSKTIVQVCQAIDAILGPDLPRSEFELKFGMAQASGCIDGIHIHIKRHIENSQSYYFKQFFSLNVQAVCDSRGRFIDVECK